MAKAPSLTPAKALIFRITHVANVPWILDNGLHCSSSSVADPAFIAIGNAGLIDRRRDADVRHPTGGKLSEYIPFYFVPRTPMMLNIRTGRAVKMRSNEEIAILVSSIPLARQVGCEVIFTDRHAYLSTAQFYDDVRDLLRLPWQAFNEYDFHRDPDNLEAFERYQAEALVKNHLPVAGLLGIGSYTSETDSTMAALVQARKLQLRTVCRPNWYMP